MTLTLETLFDGAESRVNERGNTVLSRRYDADRYLFDFRLCPSAAGWRQFDTEQDAWYFGLWYNVERRETVTYAEGDCYWVKCQNAESFKAEMDSEAKFHGAPPPMAIGIDTDGTRTEYYDENARPKL